MSSYTHKFHLAYVPVFILEPQTASEVQTEKRNATTQTDPVVTGVQNQTPKLDFSKYRSGGKPKYAPPKYRCIPAGYETDPDEELLIPHIDTNRRW